MVSFEKWEQFDARKSVYRFVTSWATKDQDIAALSSEMSNQ